MRKSWIALSVLFLCAVAAASLLYLHRQTFFQDERSGTVRAAARMTTLRSAHTATRLGDGRILIAGGMESAEGNEVNTGTAEVYDPSTNLFKTTGLMTRPRAGQTATLLHNGDVLFTGGFDKGVALDSAEIYHIATGTFRGTSNMSAKRDRHTATLLKDGRVLVVGGTSNLGSETNRSAEVYDPVTGQFTSVGLMISPRSAHAATMLADGSVLITGGTANRFDTVLAATELYDPAKQIFHFAGSMNAARHKHGATLLQDGRVLISGGSDDASRMGGRLSSAEIYDPSSQSFKVTGQMVKARFKVTTSVIAIPNGKVVICGDGEYLEVYDPASGTFSTASGSVDEAWMYATATPLDNGTVFITGGYNENMEVTAGAWIYRPAT